MPPDTPDLTSPTHRSWVRRLLVSGTDPDARFSLANERTCLAWIRTALGLIALGIGVATFVSTERIRGIAVLLAAALVLVGGLLAAGAYWRWLRVERAMREGHGIPPSRLAPVVVVAVVIFAILAFLLVLGSAR